MPPSQCIDVTLPNLCLQYAPLSGSCAPLRCPRNCLPVTQIVIDYVIEGMNAGLFLIDWEFNSGLDLTKSDSIARENDAGDLEACCVKGNSGTIPNH